MGYLQDRPFVHIGYLPEYYEVSNFKEQVLVPCLDLPRTSFILKSVKLLQGLKRSSSFDKEGCFI